MAKRKSGAKGSVRINVDNRKPAKQSESGKGTTVSGPAHPSASTTALAEHAEEQAALAKAILPPAPDMFST